MESGPPGSGPYESGPYGSGPYGFLCECDEGFMGEICEEGKIPYWTSLNCPDGEPLQLLLVRFLHFIPYTEPLLKTVDQLKLVDMYNSKLLKFYYKLYRNQLSCYFDSFLPTYGTSHYPLRYDGLHLPLANHKFCEVNAKY